jgi:hypothetical protein
MTWSREDLNNDHTLGALMEACLTARSHDPDPDFERASGQCVCTICGQEYRKHVTHPKYSHLVRTCNGRYWKL